MTTILYMIILKDVEKIKFDFLNNVDYNGLKLKNYVSKYFCR